MMRFVVEGIDRVGKDSIIHAIQKRRGHHLTLHFGKPILPEGSEKDPQAARSYQEASFRNLMQLLAFSPELPVICNRSHLGELVYAPRYRGYSGDYVLELEEEFKLRESSNLYLILLTEDFSVSRHFEDDGQSLGPNSARAFEQDDFREAFDRSQILKKRLVCVTDAETGRFRPLREIIDDVLKPFGS